MSFNILETAKRYLTPVTISEASTFIHESEENTRKALTAILPLALSGFLARADTSADEASDILDIVNIAYKQGTANGKEVHFSIGNNPSHTGLTLEKALFGDKINSLINSIAQFAQIGHSSSESLFHAATSFVATVTGKYSSDMNLSASSLASFLHSQKANILSALPIELAHIARLLGLSKIGDGRLRTTHADLPLYNEKKKPRWKLFNWMCLFLLVFLVWYFTGKKHPVRKQTAKTTIVKTVFRTATKSAIHFLS